MEQAIASVRFFGIFLFLSSVSKRLGQPVPSEADDELVEAGIV